MVTLSMKNKTSEKRPIFSGEQYFSTTKNFTLLKLTWPKIFISCFFSWIKNQITEI